MTPDEAFFRLLIELKQNTTPLTQLRFRKNQAGEQQLNDIAWYIASNYELVPRTDNPTPSGIPFPI